MAKKTVTGTDTQKASGEVLVPLYRLQVVKEAHAPLYGASKIRESGDVYRLLQSHFEGKPHEEFVAVFLDSKNTVVGYQVVSVGSLNLSIVHPREAFKAAACMNAAGVLFAHNHPSGDPTPSQEDRALTDRLVGAGDILGIRVLDHIVIGDERYVSFADSGWLNAQETVA